MSADLVTVVLRSTLTAINVDAAIEGSKPRESVADVLRLCESVEVAIEGNMPREPVVLLLCLARTEQDASSCSASDAASGRRQKMASGRGSTSACGPARPSAPCCRPPCSCAKKSEEARCIFSKLPKLPMLNDEVALLRLSTFLQEAAPPRLGLERVASARGARLRTGEEARRLADCILCRAVPRHSGLAPSAFATATIEMSR